MEQGQVYLPIICGFLKVQGYVWVIVLILLGLMILIIIYMNSRVFILRLMLVVFLPLAAILQAVMISFLGSFMVILMVTLLFLKKILL